MQKQRYLLITGIVFLLPHYAMACINCNRPLQESIFNESFISNLLLMLAPFPLAILLGGLISYRAGRTSSTYNIPPGQSPGGPIDHPQLTIRPLVAAATMLGIGMGGFVDGILLHQVLQWHQMLSNQVPPVTLAAKNFNMFWDGMFHAFTWLVTLAGILMLYRTIGQRNVIRSGAAFAGGLLMGWALFNISEGLVDHYILQLHNVRENVAQPLFYNHMFTVLSLGLLLAGLLLIARSKKITGT